MAKSSNYLLELMAYSTKYTADAYKNENDSDSDIVDTMFENKLKLVKSKLEMITRKIDERAVIKDNNLKDILYDECNVDNLMAELPDGFTPYLSPSRETLQLEKLKLTLSDKKRMEIASAWRDVSMLYNNAIDTYLDIMKQDSKKSMVEDL